MLESVRSAIARTGQALTLRRVRTGLAPIDVAVVGVLRGYQAHELAGTVVQGDRLVIITDAEIAAAAWPGPPRKGDQVLAGAAVYTVQGCDTVSLAGAVVRHNLAVRG